MGGNLDRTVRSFLQGIGMTKEQLAASEYASHKEHSPYKLYSEVKPGDHIAVWCDWLGYWHHGIFGGKDEEGEDHVIDMSGEGLKIRRFEKFMKGADASAVLEYRDALPLEESLKLAMYLLEHGSAVEYNLVKENCDKFAATCRLGRCDDIVKMADLVKRTIPYRKAPRNVFKSKLIGNSPP